MFWTAECEYAIELGSTSSLPLHPAGGLCDRAAGSTPPAAVAGRLGYTKTAQLLLRQRQRDVNVAVAHMAGRRCDHRCRRRSCRQDHPA
jgi:hypothetical protein